MSLWEPASESGTSTRSITNRWPRRFSCSRTPWWACTASPSTSIARSGMRLEGPHDLDGIDGLGDIVHAQQARTRAIGLDGRGERGCKTVLRQTGSRQAHQEGLARDADEQRPPDARETREPSQQLQVVLDGLAEADAR